MKKLSLNLDALDVVSFQSMPNKKDMGELIAGADASNESVCGGSCSCDFTACCTV